MKPRKWPVPADTALDRAKRLLWQYREELLRAAPDRCAVLDAAATELGEGWVAPRLITNDAATLTAAQLAEALGQKRATVYQWARREIIPREPDGLFVLADVETALARRRQRRSTPSRSN